MAVFAVIALVCPLVIPTLELLAGKPVLVIVTVPSAVVSDVIPAPAAKNKSSFTVIVVALVSVVADTVKPDPIASAPEEEACHAGSPELAIPNTWPSVPFCSLA